jgi:hypothetical protein
MDRGYVLAGCWVTALVVGEGVIVWGYRADRRGVPFPWERYWHWWRVSMALSMIAAVALVPIGWLAYSGRPPGRLSDLVGLLLPFLLFGIGFAHWRLWFPILGVGKPFLGTYMPREVYIQQSLRTFGYSLGLGLAGSVVVVIVGRLIFV